MKRKIIIAKSNMGFFSYLKLIWDYRFFSRSLAIGEIKNKYAKTATGIFLSLIQTLIGISIYWLIFGIAVKINTNNIPYPLFVLPGIILWQYFSGLIINSSGAILSSEDLINKLYFPRINLLIAKVFPGLVDLLLGFILFIILFIIFQYSFSITWLFIPLLILLLIVSAFGIGLWISILSLFIRDLGYIIIQIINFLIFATPVFYPGTIIPNQYKIILYINPVAGIIEYTRAAVFSEMPDIRYCIGFGFSLLLFISGIIFFKKFEKKITDML
jgi:lipopolysaccharide transport system permease protein